MSEVAKLCLICGTNSNKIAKYDRYNFAPTSTKKKGGKNQVEESYSDSEDTLNNSKSKKKAPLKPNPKAPTGPSSRQTRNKNPKTFAISLCKAMDLPDTPDEPFLQIFSNADYCGSCMTKIKDIHASQMELEKIQNRIQEYRVDIELDLSKHLQTIPFCKNVRRDKAYERYEEDITLILDYHGTDKKTKGKPKKEETEEPEPKRKRRQAAIDSDEKMKQNLDENSTKEEENDEEAKVPKEEVETDDSVLEEAPSSQTEGMDTENSSNNENGTTADDEGALAEDKAEPLEPVEVQEKVKPLIVKVKKDPNLKCPHCPIPRYFNIPESLEEHVARVHVDRRKFACDLCDRKCHSQKELQSHKQKAHDVQIETVGWVCGFCDKDFQQKRYLEDHLDRHEEAKPLNCQFCGRGFARKESLQKAFQIYKGEPVEPCNRCGRNLNLKDYLEHNRRLKEKV